jgi:hypothetical protein
VRWLLRSLAALSGCHEGLDGESDSFGFKVSAKHLDLDDLAGFHGLGRLLDKTVGELADVDQTILVDADVHEGSKLGDVGDHALKDHAGLNVGELADGLEKLGAVNWSRGSRSGLRSSSRMSETVKVPAESCFASTLVRS